MTGGLRTDLINASWPFANLTASREALRLSVLSKEFSIGKDSITKLVKHRGLLTTGIKIEHAIPGVPTGPVFWTFSFAKLERNLEQLGYSVEE